MRLACRHDPSRPSRGACRRPLAGRLPVAAALALAGLALCAAPPAQAGGSTSHLAQASYALDELGDPQLKAKLVLHLNAYLNGSNFPDTFNIYAIPGAAGPWLSYYSADEAHSAHFLSTYAAYVVANPGNDVLLAHFMGTLAHVVGDQRFDRYFMTRVTRECFPETYVGAAQPKYAQVYTDQDLDWVLSPLRFPPSFPASGILSPIDDFVPWEVGHWSPLFVPPSILELAYPEKTPIAFPVLSAGVAAAWLYITTEPYFIHGSLLGYGPASTFCDYGEATWLHGVGGAHDGGRVIADYLERVHAILQAGGLPEFEDYGVWPYNELRVRDAWSSDPVPADFGSWIAGPQGIERIELEGDRIVAFEDTPGARRLWQLDGYVEGTWSELLATPDGLTSFALEGERTGVLHDDGRLLLHAGPGASWSEVLQGVSDFQLDGERVGALVDGELWIQDGDPQSPWAPVVLPASGLPGVERVDRFEIEGPSQPLATGPITAAPLATRSLPRIAVLTRQRGANPGEVVSRLRIGEGHGTSLAWQTVWQQLHAPGQQSAVSFQLDGPRVGLLVDGTLTTYEGALGAAGTVQQAGVAEFQLAGGCLAALRSDGELLLQRGDLGEPWQVIAQGVSGFELEGYNEAWPSADPWLAYTLQDGTLLTNRTASAWPGQTLPHSHEHAMPGAGSPAGFRVETTSPEELAGVGTIKIEDRLAVLLAGRVFVAELPRFAYAPSSPSFFLSPFEGPLSDRVQLNWDPAGAGPQDYVALYDKDPNSNDAGPDGYLFGQWQWATNGPAWVSAKKWSAGYYMAYVEEDATGKRTITKTWGPTGVAQVQSLGVQKAKALSIDWVALDWTAKGVGHKDFVALYDQDPLAAGPDGYLPLQWQWARKASPWTSARPYKAGYYAAYVSEDAQGDRTILDVAGPTTTTVGNVWLSKHTFFFFFSFFQLNWSVTDPGHKDYVALYAQDPHVAGPGGYLALQWTWGKQGPTWVTSKPWAPGHYMAYVQEDAQGHRTIKATWGPSK